METAGTKTTQSYHLNNHDLLLIILWCISAINQYFAFGFGIITIISGLWKRDPRRLLKAFILYVLRVSSMNKILFSNISIPALKYAVMFAFALSMILISNIPECYLKHFKKIRTKLCIYSTYVVISAFFVSAYPLVSVVKLLLFLLAFIGVLKAVAATWDYDWIGFFCLVCTIILVASVFTIPFVVFRTRNVRFFQGVLGHPNIFGIFGAIAICFIISNNNWRGWIKGLLCSATLYMQYISASRTGMFSSILFLMVAFVVAYKKRLGKMFIIAIILLLFLYITISFVPGISDRITQFFWKSARGDLFFSRSVQINRFHESFDHHRIFGTGFMTPYVPDYKSYEMNLNLYVEDGNVIFAVLRQTGIVGFFLWLLLYGTVFLNGKRDLFPVFLVPFLVSSGEMVFFSTNSVGAILYTIFAIYLFCYKTKQY